MDGTTTLEEEDLLSRYFLHGDVPAAWHDYQLLFQEIEAMKPQTTAQSAIPSGAIPGEARPPVAFRPHWLRWSAAAVAVGFLAIATVHYMEHSPQTSPVHTAKAEYKDTADVLRPAISDKQIPADTTVMPRTPEKKTPPQQKRRSLRKPEPTMTDYDKGYALLAEAEEERRQVEQQIMEVRQEVIRARLTAAGFVAIQEEDGNIIYVNEPKEYFAYEE